MSQPAAAQQPAATAHHQAAPSPLLLLLLLPPVQHACRASADANDTSWLTLNHAPGYCAMYDICGHRKDGDVLNCPNNTRVRAAQAAARQPR